MVAERLNEDRVAELCEELFQAICEQGYVYDPDDAPFALDDEFVPWTVGMKIFELLDRCGYSKVAAKYYRRARR